MKPGFSRKSPEGGDSMMAVPGGKIQMGVSVDTSCGFVWDNEGPPKVAPLSGCLRCLEAVFPSPNLPSDTPHKASK